MDINQESEKTNKYNSEDSIELTEIIRELRLNYILILVITAISLGLSIYYAIISEDIYSSKSIIRIVEPQKSIFGDKFQDLGIYQEPSIENEIEIMKLYSLREKVAEELLKLVEKEDFNEYSIMVSGNGEDIPFELKSKEKIANLLSSYVSISQRGKLEIVDITTESQSPRETALISNIYAKVFLESNLLYNRKQLTNIKLFLKKQVDEKFDELLISEKQISDYQEKGGIVSLDAQAQSTIDILSNFEAQRNSNFIELSIIENSLSILKSELSQKEPGITKYLASLQTEKYIQDLQEEISKLQVRKDLALIGSEALSDSKKLIENYDNKIVDLKNLMDSKIEELKSKIYLQSPDGVKEIIDEIFELELKKKGLETSNYEIGKIIEIYEDRFNKFPTKIIEFARLQREREILEQLYLLMQDKYQQALVNEQSVPQTVTILEEARVPNVPIKPSRPRIVLIGTLLGLFLSIGFILVRYFFNNTIKSPEDFQKIQLKLLGWIPKLQTKRKIITPEEEFVLKNKPSSSVAEAFRSLRTRIQHLSPSEKKGKIILLSSGSAREGKTFVNCNLAASFAYSSSETLIIDFDLRKPRISKFLGVPKSPGIVEYFYGKAELDDIVRKYDLENLYYITSGKIPFNPAEILSSEKIYNLLQELRNRFDYIILDSPPVLAVTDSEILSSIADASIIVARAGVTEKGVLLKTVEIMKTSSNNFLGILLNEFEMKKEYGAYYKYFYYYEQSKDKISDD